MQRERVVQLIALLVMALCLAASGVLANAIASSAGQNRLVYADQAEKGDPPEVAAGIAMGAFRGIFVNMLWIRANDLKEAGKYHEAVDLARNITRLQPRFPRVWAFHAWNLAYNISVSTQTEPERWQWVQSGMRLLRDEGIPANPSDILLHKELAWILLHKVQGFMDDANWYYKREFAREWTIVLGPPPPRTADRSTTEQMTEAYAAKLQRIVDARETLPQLEAEFPVVSQIVERLRTQAGLDLAGRLWDEAGNGPGERILRLNEEQRSLGRITGALNIRLERRNMTVAETSTVGIMSEALTDEASRPAVDALFAFMRKRILIDKYHMEPDRMLRYTREYGPLDWRHPAAHALYWSARGVDEALFRINSKNRGDFDILNTDRITIQSLQELYRTGEITFDIFNSQFYLQLPNPDFIDSYEKILYRLVDRSAFVTDKGEYVTPDKGRPWSMYSAGYENFLRDVIRFVYRRGDIAKAEMYYKKLRDFDKRNINNTVQMIYDDTVPIEEFVANEIVKDDRFASTEVARSEITAALQSAYVSGLLVGNMKLYSSQFDYARKFHALYVDRQVKNTNVNQGSQARMEVVDRDFDTYAARILMLTIMSAGLPDGPIIYARAPQEVLQRAYPMLLQTPLAGQLDAAKAAGAGPGFDVVFPPPPGMDDFRKKLQAEQAKQENRGKTELK